MQVILRGGARSRTGRKSEAVISEKGGRNLDSIVCYIWEELA